MKPNWMGYYASGTNYFVGDVVVFQSHVFMARNLPSGPPAVHRWEMSGDWILLGKQENSKIDHYYFPEGIQIPLPSGKMSEMTYICVDCWKNCNFAAAFMPDEHAYMINELP